MLDLSKLKAGKTSTELQYGDIIVFLKYLVEAHNSLATRQHVSLQFHSAEDPLFMDFDRKKVEQVISNLISNAVKFTPKLGTITIEAKKVLVDNCSSLHILVKDNGIGISSDRLPYIFERFNQANLDHSKQGSGIGLALVKEHLNSIDASISVTSELGKGTCFQLIFPIHHNESSTDIVKSSSNGISKLKNDTNKELPLILIIEDNADVAYYLQTCLHEKYQLATCRNGKEGVEEALNTLPDIIISDVMMPEMDGFELCSTLKVDERTSHIPIILLTAKSTSEDKLMGLSQGADAYLIKPFAKAELLIRIQNLLDVRKKLQSKYSKILMSNVQDKKVLNNKEDNFLLKVEQAVLNNTNNENFSVQNLMDALNLSRSQVHRKIKALTGMSTNIYIRQIRLYKAKDLLQQTTLSITEIAYEVGFKSPSYFSNVFKQELGESPSSFVNNASHPNP